MNSKSVLGVLSAIGILALFVTAVEAGGAAGAASFGTFFECQAINGANVGEVVSTHEFDDSNSVLQSNVRIGNAVLLCRQVNVKNSVGAFVNPTLSDQLKCYTVNVQGPQGGSEVRNLEDGFIASDPVRVFQPLRYLCGPTIQRD